MRMNQLTQIWISKCGANRKKKKNQQKPKCFAPCDFGSDKIDKELRKLMETVQRIVEKEGENCVQNEAIHDEY